MVNQMAVASGGSEKEFDFGYIMKVEPSTITSFKNTGYFTVVDRNQV